MIYANKKNLFKVILYNIFIYVLFLLTFSLIWCGKNFENISINEIMFTLNMPLKGTPNNYFRSYILAAPIPSLLAFLVLVILYHFLKRPFKYDIFLKIKLFKYHHTIKASHFKSLLLLTIKRSSRILPLVWLCLILIVANYNYQLLNYIKGYFQASDFIENEYVSAKEININFPEDKKNLICIFIESAETTFQDKANGGIYDKNVIPEMTEIAKSNISFSQSDLLEGAAVAPGTGWTVAALTAQTAGIPLKLYKYEVKVDNGMGKYEYFLPGAVSIGDILEQQGYHNFFMAGSDVSHGGKRNYFTQHGNYEIWDYLTAIEEGKIPSDYKVGWGFEDQKLYAFAKEKLLELASEDRPFNFSMLTVDTHMSGEDDAFKSFAGKFDDPYLNVWASASEQLADFITWIQEQEFYDNTVIYIAGDHASMQKGDFMENYAYDKHNGSTERKVYNVFINSVAKPTKTTNRKFTTLDLFPSILASLGADIEGDRIGLGTNLFSERQTLSEQYGYEEVFNELNKKSLFYDKEILYP